MSALGNLQALWNREAIYEVHIRVGCGQRPRSTIIGKELWRPRTIEKRLRYEESHGHLSKSKVTESAGLRKVVRPCKRAG